MNFFRRISGLMSAVALVGLNPVQAKGTQTGAVAATADASGLEMIVFTDQRQSEHLEQTPAAVAVLAEDLLAKHNIVTQSDFVATVAGHTISASLNSNDFNRRFGYDK